MFYTLQKSVLMIQKERILAGYLDSFDVFKKAVAMVKFMRENLPTQLLRAKNAKLNHVLPVKHHGMKG